MPFENVIGGKLKLKGKPLPSKGFVKKKKKSKNAALLDKLQEQALRDAEAALAEEAARGGAAGLHEMGDGGDEAEGGEREKGRTHKEEEVVDTRTEAEKRYHEQLQKLETKRAQEFAKKSHRQRVEEFNKSLASMTEHYDIPKVGPG